MITKIFQKKKSIQGTIAGLETASEVAQGVVTMIGPVIAARKEPPAGTIDQGEGCKQVMSVGGIKLQGSNQV